MIDLKTIEKPIRYIGNEWNAIQPDPNADVRMTFCFPDVYEVGMSYLGMQILYGLLNQHPNTSCERAFTPWPDYENKLRETNQPLTTLESQTPLSDMDLVGFSLQHEMLYTNILTMLDLGGIPLLRKDRSDNDPIVIAGGPCVYNPLPIEDFVDAFLLGEGEEVLLEFCDTLRQAKRDQSNRTETLRRLSKIKGVYIPTFYERTSNRLGEVFPDTPIHNDLPKIIERRIVTNFEDSFYPTKQVVPNTKIIHNRLSLEIMRGCPGGCRFCHAGFVTRPTRERSVDRLMRDARETLRQTGMNEIGLLSLSTADYTGLPQLCTALIDNFASEKIALSLPSLRIDQFPSRITEEIGKVRSSGLTFAPEAGTDRLRFAVNKRITNQEIFDKIEQSVSAHQDTIKFYFMIGLPTETDEDLQGIVDMMKEIKKRLRAKGNRRGTLHIGLSPFVPKPHTPFQWIGQIPLEELYNRIHWLASQLKALRFKVNWHDPRKSQVEAAFSRGDSRLGKVILEAYNQGARFDEWQEYFDHDRWQSAFASQGIDLASYATRNYEEEDSLPWNMFSILVDQQYLWKEWKKTHDQKTTQHCGLEVCRACKVCDGDEVVTVRYTPPIVDENAQYNMEHDMVETITADTPKPSNKTYRYRLRFSKTGKAIYASHHDIMGMIEQSLRRAEVPIAFSEGFHPHPKIVFASALSLGVESHGEYLDLTTTESIPAEDVMRRLNANIPPGLFIQECQELSLQSKKVTAIVRAFVYHVHAALDAAEEDTIQKLQAIAQEDQFLTKNQLISFHFLTLTNSEIVVSYTSHVIHGKFTKAEDIFDQLRERIDYPIQISKIIRKDMLMENGEKGLQPILVPRDHPDTSKLCNVKSS